MSATGRGKLSSQERRWMAAVAMILFVVVNVLYVWPHFGDWSKAQKALQEKQRELSDYQAEVARVPQFSTRLAELSGQTSAVLSEDQSGELMRIVQNQVQRSGVNVIDTSLGGALAAGPKAKYFMEQTVRVQFTGTGDKEIISLLLALSSGNSSIRVRDVQLRPDPSGSKLMGTIQVVGTYQRAKVLTNEPPAKGKAVAEANK